MLDSIFDVGVSLVWFLMYSAFPFSSWPSVSKEKGEMLNTFSQGSVPSLSEELLLMSVSGTFCMTLMVVRSLIKEVEFKLTNVQPKSSSLYCSLMPPLSLHVYLTCSMSSSTVVWDLPWRVLDVSGEQERGKKSIILHSETYCVGIKMTVLSCCIDSFKYASVKYFLDVKTDRHKAISTGTIPSNKSWTRSGGKPVVTLKWLSFSERTHLFLTPEKLFRDSSVVLRWSEWRSSVMAVKGLLAYFEFLIWKLYKIGIYVHLKNSE